MAAKRNKYDAGFKLKVIEFAKKSNNSSAGRHFDVSEKLVRDWRKAEEKLKNMPKNKCALRTGKTSWPELEDAIFQWVMEQRQNGYVVSRNAIRIQALKWAKLNANNAVNFKATNSWCYRFMQRKSLSLRAKTKIAQKLPKELEEKITNFQRFVINLRKKYDYPLGMIGNMDETAVNFDMPSNRTVNVKGEKTILIKTTGNEKKRFTVVLACMADGKKLRPMVIFKRKTMPKVKFPPGIFVHVHENGWMDEEGIALWLKNVWNKRAKTEKSRSLLVWDMFGPHKSEATKKRLQRYETDVAVIPGGLTSVIQPLDVGLNKPFKDALREQWNQWMIDGEKTFTEKGNMRAVPLETLCGFILKAWDMVKTDSIVKAFKKCSISNAMDGTEDDCLWQSDDSSSDSDTMNENEWDPYDVDDEDTSSNDILKLLFDSDSDGSEFSGF